MTLWTSLWQRLSTTTAARPYQIFENAYTFYLFLTLILRYPPLLEIWVITEGSYAQWWNQGATSPIFLVFHIFFTLALSSIVCAWLLPQSRVCKFGRFFFYECITLAGAFGMDMSASIVLFLMIFWPRQADSWDKPNAAVVAARWHFILMYFSAVTAKMGDSHWQDGSALHILLSSHRFAVFPTLGQLLPIEVSALIGYSVMAIQLFFTLSQASGWYARTSWMAVLALHVSMLISSKLTTFQIYMIISLMIFYPFRNQSQTPA